MKDSVNCPMRLYPRDTLTDSGNKGRFPLLPNLGTFIVNGRHRRIARLPCLLLECFPSAFFDSALPNTALGCSAPSLAPVASDSPRCQRPCFGLVMAMWPRGSYPLTQPLGAPGALELPPDASNCRLPSLISRIFCQ